METASTFEILPAIDLRGGRVVRLQQGDFGRETAFSSEPAQVALRFADAGARWLHVVDLDGARDGSPAHTAVIREIVDAVGDRVAVEVAGGLRDETVVTSALETGAARVVVGTAALEDARFAARLVAEHGPGRIVVAVDVRRGEAVGHGWAAEAGGQDPAEIITRLADVGVQTFEVTAIERDGLLIGPDLELYERMVAIDRGAMIASAGISTLDDLRAVRSMGCTGAIVGRALYEGRLDLRVALEAVREETSPQPPAQREDRADGL
jgi:phosphoribosylformimino-5-aminoimidazole carboxamide ribotide isomerase